MRPDATILTVGHGYRRRPYRPGDERGLNLRPDFAAQWVADPGLPEGPIWSLERTTSTGALTVLGVGGLTRGDDGIWTLWGLSGDLDSRGWAAVRVFARHTLAWAERALNSWTIRALAPANRPEAASLLARLGFEVEGSGELSDGTLARIMMRGRD